MVVVFVLLPLLSQFRGSNEVVIIGRVLIIDSVVVFHGLLLKDLGTGRLVVLFVQR